MRPLIIFLLSTLFAFASSAEATASKVRDETAIGREVLKDFARRGTLPTEFDVSGHDCDDRSPGSSICWKRCTYSVASCAQSCGVNSEEGAGECWNRCTFSVSSCGQICGTRTRSGQAECWNRCTYSVESCKQICGI